MRRWRIGIAFLGTLASAAGGGTATAQTAPAKAITNENRLFQRFVEDGAVTENVWFEGQFRYQSFDHSDVITVGPVIAVNVAEDIELGGRIDLRSVDPDPGDSETGFSDLDVYGKIRLSTKPTQIALGVLLKLPTGDEEKALGTGEMDVAFFGGLRHDVRGVSLVASAGLRINQDPDILLPPARPGVPPAQLEGETSVQLGGAMIFPMTTRLAGVVETSFETERIDRAGSDFRLTLGGDYRRSEGFAGRVGLVVGNGNGAPEFEVIASGVFLF